MPYDIQQGHALDLIPTLPDDSIDVVVTSPPFYGESYEEKIIPGWGRLGAESDPAMYVKHCCQILDALVPKLKRTALVWVVLRDAPGPSGLLGLPQEIGKQARLEWVYTMYWVLDSIYMPKGFVPFGPITATLPIIGFAKTPDYHYWPEGQVTPDYLAYSTPETKKGDMFQSLPPELVGDLLDVSCPTGGTVLDPMCGSGTVPAIAAARGCYGIGFDISELAVKSARRKCIRLKEMVHSELAARRQKMGPSPAARKN